MNVRFAIKRGFVSLLFSSLLSMAVGQKRDTIQIWQKQVPGEALPKAAPEYSGDKSGNVTRISRVTNPTLTVYKPDPKKRNDAAVIVCPGGGYNILAIDLEGYEIAEWLSSLGYTAFVLQYRVPQKQYGALNDIQRAIRLVRSNVKQYSIDEHKIGVLGFSAGGSLCARAATRFDEKTYQPSDAIDNFSSRPDFAMLIYPAYLDEGASRTLTPELKNISGASPHFIFGTADDPYGNSCLVMAGALRDSKIPVELHFLPKGGHGYGLRRNNVAAERWPVLAARWLESLWRQ